MTTASISIPFSNDFADFATQLRQAGARFFVSPQGNNRILEFKQLTPAAENLLHYFAQSLSEQVTNSPDEIEAEEAISEITPEEPEIIAPILYLSEEELKAKTKNQLLKLAQENTIIIPSDCQLKAEIVKFLVGKIPA